MKGALPHVDRQWTLFIDRDGVINVERPGKYVNNWEEFEFNPGVVEAFSILTAVFGKILMVTNQRGVARGITTKENLAEIHENMLSTIRGQGGRIDKIYVCPDMDGENRKPNIGMGLQALKDFPDIDLAKSMMVGDKISDMQFGRNLNVAVNILLTSDFLPTLSHPDLIDFVFADLYTFATGLSHS